MSIYWVSWYQPTQDFRPISFPPNKNILGWWKTGEDISNESILVAIVDATSIDHVKAIVHIDWPEVTNWRFIDKRKTLYLNDRFILTGWMIERINNFNESKNETIYKI